MKHKSPPIVILTGPTASGKTALALEAAARLNGELELINADSLLVYRGLSIGTAKPSEDELQQVPHHLVDIRNPNEGFTAGEFYRAVEQAIQDIQARGKKPLIVGGTGFYLKALLFGLWEAPASSPELRKHLETLPPESLWNELSQKDAPSAQRIGPSDRYRLIRALELITLTGKTPSQLEAAANHTADPRFHLWILDRSTETLRQRIQQRTQQMLASGLIEETVAAESQFPNARPLQAIGYAQVKRFLRGESPAGRQVRPGLEGLADEINLATQQLVKQQRTWFRKLASQVPQSQVWLLEDSADPQSQLLLDSLTTLYKTSDLR
jgi:tRNA dimethylallyltransferase